MKHQTPHHEEIRRLRHQAAFELNAAADEEARALRISIAVPSVEACFRRLLLELADARRRAARALLLDALHKLEMAALRDPKAVSAFRLGARSILAQTQRISEDAVRVRTAIAATEEAILH